MDVRYADLFTTNDADEVGFDEDGKHISPAPFGDDTWRVISEDEGGVIAYFNNAEDARTFAAL